MDPPRAGTPSTMLPQDIFTGSNGHNADLEVDNLASYEQYVEKKRRNDIQRGTKNVLMMEQLADTTWRPVVPSKERAKFLNKLGPLKSRQSSSWSNPSGSPRPGAGSSLSVATFAGVTDSQYMHDVDRRLMYDKFRMQMREKTNIFPTDIDIETVNKKPPHSPRAVSYVPVMVHMPITVKPIKPRRLKPINREYEYPEDVDEHTRKKRKSIRLKKDRRGPTQYQSNTGLVMVMKPQEHALVGTVYENRPLKQEYNELIKFRMDPEKLRRESTMEMLERCDQLLNPVKAEKKRKKREVQITPTDWNRTISATPNINDLRSVLGESPITQSRKTKNSKTKDVPISKPISLQQIMKPEGKPKYYIDSVSKCVSWLNKNFT